MKHYASDRCKQNTGTPLRAIAVIALFLAGCTTTPEENPAAGLENKDDLLSMRQGAVLLRASSQYDNVSLDAFHLFDDCDYTKWNSAKNRALNNTFDVELQSPSHISDILINNERSQDYACPGIQAKTVRVLASSTTPDSGYEQLAEVVVKKLSSKHIALDQKAAAHPYKWFRFTVVDNWGFPEATELYEIQAYGTRATGSADKPPHFRAGVYGGDRGPLKFVSEGNTLFGIKCKPDKDEVGMLGSVHGNQARVFYPQQYGQSGVELVTQSEDGEVVNIARYYRFSPKDPPSNLFALQNREKSPAAYNREPDTSIEKLIQTYLSHYGKAVLYGIDFKPDSPELTSDSDSTLNAVASLMKNQPKLRLSVEAHNGWTDSNPIRNIALDYHDDSVKPHVALSEARAQTVIDWLCNHNVNRSRLQAKGWGKNEPVFLDGVETPRQSIILNRRIELIPLKDSAH